MTTRTHVVCRFSHSRIAIFTKNAFFFNLHLLLPPCVHFSHSFATSSYLGHSTASADTILVRLSLALYRSALCVCACVCSPLCFRRAHLRPFSFVFLSSAAALSLSVRVYSFVLSFLVCIQKSNLSLFCRLFVCSSATFDRIQVSTVASPRLVSTY